METLKAWVRIVGAGPLVLMGVGLLLMVRRSRRWWVPLWAGIAWGAYNLLWATRDATLSIGSGGTITFTRDGHPVTFTETVSPPAV